MPWLILILSGVLEAVWATALGASHGLSRLGPTVIFLVGLTASMVGLGWAVRRVPIGTAYAVWTGIGAALTVVWAMATGAEAVSWLKVLCLIGIVGSVVGLRLVGDDGADTDRAEVSEPPRRAWRRSRSERLL
jgi:quaternary ammonium compound-resistance protein SugE